MKAFRTFLNRRTVPATAPGERVYAVGDIHGRTDLLQRMLVAIGKHSAELGPPERLHIVIIGDVIDRGRDSRGSLEALDEARNRMPELVILLGNHEEMLLRTLAGDEGTLRGWMRVGGVETVQSFGLEPFVEGEDAVPWVAALRRAVPKAWVDWIATWPLTARSGDYLFAHAGVRPGVALKRQARQHFLWGHEAFLEDTRDHGAVIVHGHTIFPEVDIRANRIGIDTGAYSSNTLSAICLDGTSQTVLAVSGDPPA
ncbi:serine/threonine protein phosphatase 1 [Novosphingobium sp. CF614]|uniref:metallophosphoesterase n=1 Tax=Novosphingobium sp. CF614 TaxID=1884364 RepID=UPI0008E00594|nr:metallophosphoesterase [Novosphingobium sp. CF614]SFG20061.1 serine/threonine protein phosphatase 1 [Novosphingobium sp. CF614]